MIRSTMLTGGDLGRRVVVRHRLADRPLSTDVLGVLVGLNDDGLRVLTAAGEEVPVNHTAVVAAKTIPPGRHHDDVDDLVLEQICARNWPAATTEPLGGWLLRAAGGWTGRANSVLTVGEPGLDLDEALLVVTQWYSALGLVPMMQVPLPKKSTLATALIERGWQDTRGALVMTAPLDTVLDAVDPAESNDLPPVELESEPDEQWLAHYNYGGGMSPPPYGMAVLNGGSPLFASVRSAGTTIAIARITIEGRWLGLGAVEVDHAHRRKGLARHLLRAVAVHGAEHDVNAIWLQTWPENTPAISLYARAGFRTHHTYRYFRPA